MKRLLVILFCVVVIPISVFHLLKSDSGYDEAGTYAAILTQDTVSDLSDDEAEQTDIEDPRNQVDRMIEGELRIREIEPILKKFARACENLQLLNETTRSLIVPDLRGFDIASCTPVAAGADEKAADEYQIELNQLQPAENGPEELWQKLLADVKYFEFVRFYPVKVSPTDYESDRFSIDAGFEALAKTEDGWLSMKAAGELGFTRINDHWRIAKWDYEKFSVSNTGRRMFRDATAEIFAADDYQQVRRSVHFEILLDAIGRGGKFRNNLYNRFFPRGGTTGRHPSIAIVDIDRDGWDDLYIVEQWRKNMFFRNLGDGSFEEVSAQYGLDIKGLGTSGIFADFDNDGDDDLFLGRSFARSMYLENIEGKFVDKTAQRFGSQLPFLATAVSVADFNNDGLLDIYLATYGFPAVPPRRWIQAFLSPEDRQKYVGLRTSDEYQRFVNAPGPPNVLYENKGDRFVVSEFSSQVETWANTFQGTWSDFDNDGDQDLYVANDFARDYLFRNDGEAGFADVTFDVGDESMTGFGMGAAWGDYDQDGLLDLYVSNMYSKAGMRITQHFGQLDKRFRRSADGNRLYKNVDGKLKLVSANDGEGLNVHNAGWSWGGQFADFDNDGYLDLYVCSGYFTAPQLYATDIDL